MKPLLLKLGFFTFIDMIVTSFLQKGDKVAVVAPAKKVNKENTLQGIKILESWDLQVKIGDSVFESSNQFAGSDVQRKADLQGMIDDQEIKAIFMLRGGYGTTRIIDDIDFKPLQNAPKWICGFSDITALHSHLYSIGIVSLHAPMPTFFYALEPEPLGWLRRFLFGKEEKLTFLPQKMNRIGEEQGRLVGGNLSIICHAIGTSSQVKTEGNILFIEDIGEEFYSLDRMMVQLKRSGLLQNIRGLVVGQFTEMKDSDPFGLGADEIIMSHVEHLSIPVAFNAPIGHCTNNFAVPVGMKVDFEVNEKEISLSFKQE